MFGEQVQLLLDLQLKLTELVYHHPSDYFHLNCALDYLQHRKYCQGKIY